jgi:hypothetical protein
MKHLRKIFENKEENLRFIEDCFLDISENPNFEVNQTEDFLNPRVATDLVYILNISLDKTVTLPQPVSSNLYIGMVETSLEFLRMKNEKLNELYNDIEVAMNRINDRFGDKSNIKIKANRRDEIGITITIKN